MRVINIKCESDSRAFSQEVHAIEVVREDAGNWYAKPLSNPACPVLQYPKFAWKEVN